jgi:NagD protein|tara:strand:- start:358 stop:1263 length:906 start_codon:yes stop_codon:yes gene_type:complete
MPEQIYSAAIIDLNGVVYEHGETRADGTTEKIIRPGAREFLDFLVDSPVPHLFATNTTSQMKEDVAIELAESGLEITPNNIFSCVEAGLQYLQQEDLRRVYLISSSDKLRARFRTYEHEGFRIELVSSYDSTHPDDPNNKIDAVVVGFDREFHSRTRNDATDFVMGGARIVALNMNENRPKLDGTHEWNVGACVAGLVCAAKIRPEDVYNAGKPNREFYVQAQSMLGYSLSRVAEVLVIGDDPEADLRGARDRSMATAFFPSRKDAEWPSDLGFSPDVTVRESLEELIPYFIVPQGKNRQE